MYKSYYFFSKFYVGLYNLFWICSIDNAVYNIRIIIFLIEYSKSQRRKDIVKNLFLVLHFTINYRFGVISSLTYVEIKIIVEILNKDLMCYFIHCLICKYTKACAFIKKLLLALLFAYKNKFSKDIKIHLKN